MLAFRFIFLLCFSASYLSSFISTHGSSSPLKSRLHLLQVMRAITSLQKSVSYKESRQNASAMEEQTKRGYSPATAHGSPAKKEDVSTEASTFGFCLQRTDRSGHFQGEFSLHCFRHGLTCPKGAAARHRGCLWWAVLCSAGV